MDALETCAFELGLTLPTTFVKFMRDKTLLARIPAQVFLGPLCKVRKSGNGQEKTRWEGYLVNFMADYDRVYYFSLYLNARGGRCILRNERSVVGSKTDDHLSFESDVCPMLKQVEESLGISALGTYQDMNQAAVDAYSFSFESWLAGFFYGEIAYTILEREENSPEPWKQLPDAVLEYIASFTEKGNEAVNRGLTPAIPSRK
jgi:hypothetical protein